LGAIALAFD
jgi:hypothetical protein